MTVLVGRRCVDYHGDGGGGGSQDASDGTELDQQATWGAQRAHLSK